MNERLEHQLLRIEGVMTTEPTNANIHEIARLCMCGDWASAHGDFAGLRQIARQLEDFVTPPVIDELLELASACVSDPVRAGAIWNRVKDTLHGHDAAR